VKRIVLIGGGGFSKEVAEVAELNGHVIVGCVDDASSVRVACPHWGPLSVLDSRRGDFDAVALGIGAVDRATLTVRARIASWIRESGFGTVPLVSPHAVISKGVRLADSVYIAHGVVVSVDASIEDFVILNSGATVGHDAVVGAQTIVAPCAFVGGTTTLGERCLIGPGASLLQGLVIGESSIVSVGCVVLRSLAAGSTVVPQRPKVIRPT
jgi:sugar O-acyltransferase (sialic acid O-acetyltransferase NeuD family)